MIIWSNTFPICTIMAERPVLNDFSEQFQSSNKLNLSFHTPNKLLRHVLEIQRNSFSNFWFVEKCSVKQNSRVNENDTYAKVPSGSFLLNIKLFLWRFKYRNSRFLRLTVTYYRLFSFKEVRNKLNYLTWRKEMIFLSRKATHRFISSVNAHLLQH